MSDKKFNFDWEGGDDTGADEVDPIYAPYIPPAVVSTNNGYGGNKSQQQRSSYGVNGKDDRVVPPVLKVQGMQGKVGMYGRGMLAGFDREGNAT